MKLGLPLAIPYIPDLLVTGQIVKAFGNWEGPNTYLAFVISPGPQSGDPEKPPNLTMNVPDGKPFGDAISTTLQNAYPGYKVVVEVSNGLKMKGQQAGYWGTLTQFAVAVSQLTQDKQFRGIKRIDGLPYGGVVMTVIGKLFNGTYGHGSMDQGAGACL